MSETQRHTWSQARTSFRQGQRESIALAAIELLMESGSAELSMSTIAERAGISRQTLYRYFPDLASVLAASTDGLELADQALRAWVLEETDPRDQLHRLADGLIDAADQHAGSVEELLAALPPEAREAIRAHQVRTVALFAEVLASLRAQKSVAYAGDPETDAPMFLGLVSAANPAARKRVHQLITQLTE